MIAAILNMYFYHLSILSPYLGNLEVGFIIDHTWVECVGYFFHKSLKLPWNSFKLNLQVQCSNYLHKLTTHLLSFLQRKSYSQSWINFLHATREVFADNANIENNDSFAIEIILHENQSLRFLFLLSEWSDNCISWLDSGSWNREILITRSYS